MNNNLVIVGMSGYGRKAKAIAEATGHNVLGFLDDDLTYSKQDGYLGNLDRAPEFDAKFFVAIGDGEIRQIVVKRLVKLLPLIEFASLIHPTARVDPTTYVGVGVFIDCDTLVGEGGGIYDFVFVDNDVVIGSKCYLGYYGHVSGGVFLLGHIWCGKHIRIGMGATIWSNLNLNDYAVVTPGSLVKQNVPDHSIAYGVPAIIRRRSVVDNGN
jgi:sugar O-acyltransferase (sialic acid O-acetyltransferase NeuD family)